MIYKAIGIMSGSSLDGLDIAFAQLEENAGKWQYDIIAADCVEYDGAWQQHLANAVQLNAYDYQLLHTAYGHYIGGQVNTFIEKHQLQHKVHLIASHGHTVFHVPEKKMTAQIGDGAAIAAVTGLPVVSDLRAMDIALGGQGAPLVPVGEKFLFTGFDAFLNIGGIANISLNSKGSYIAFDLCPANRVLNMLANEAGLPYDKDGAIAASGIMSEALLQQLQALEYYGRPYPKSLDNGFGTNVVYPLIKEANISNADALRTYTEHIALQVSNALTGIKSSNMLVTGGGAFNLFLMERIKALVADKGITLTVPDATVVQYKEALVMALIGVLRWREETNTLPTVTGASRAGIGGAMWLGA
jgi:anhydro-N-acetylmuramic acid kinase